MCTYSPAYDYAKDRNKYYWEKFNYHGNLILFSPPTKGLKSQWIPVPPAILSTSTPTFDRVVKDKLNTWHILIPDKQSPWNEHRGTCPLVQYSWREIKWWDTVKQAIKMCVTYRYMNRSKYTAEYWCFVQHPATLCFLYRALHLHTSLGCFKAVQKEILRNHSMGEVMPCRVIEV